MSKALEAAARAAFLHARTGGYGYIFADAIARAFWEQAMARGITAYLRAVGEDEAVFSHAANAMALPPETEAGTMLREMLTRALYALEPKDD